MIMTAAENDDDLEADVINFMRDYTADGGYFDATFIGLNVGFDRNTAARNVRGVLNKLIKRGIIEQNKEEKPIIYRLIPFRAVTTMGENTRAGEEA